MCLMPRTIPCANRLTETVAIVFVDCRAGLLSGRNKALVMAPFPAHVEFLGASILLSILRLSLSNCVAINAAAVDEM